MNFRTFFKLLFKNYDRVVQSTVGNPEVKQAAANAMVLNTLAHYGLSGTLADIRAVFKLQRIKSRHLSRIAKVAQRSQQLAVLSDFITAQDLRAVRFVPAPAKIDYSTVFWPRLRAFTSEGLCVGAMYYTPKKRYEFALGRCSYPVTSRAQSEAHVVRVFPGRVKWQAA